MWSLLTVKNHNICLSNKLFYSKRNKLTSSTFEVGRTRTFYSNRSCACSPSADHGPACWRAEIVKIKMDSSGLWARYTNQSQRKCERECVGSSSSYDRVWRFNRYFSIGLLLKIITWHFECRYRHNVCMWTVRLIQNISTVHTEISIFCSFWWT